MPDIPWSLDENRRRMLAGELYYAFAPDLIAARARCTEAVNRFNASTETSRRARVKLWRDVIDSKEPMPPVLDDPEKDAAQFTGVDPWIEPPLHMDYGTQVYIDPLAFINFNATFLDTCPIKIGARVLVGPNCSFYSGTHPLDPKVRNGIEGPELGKDVVIDDDCWLGGAVTILPGVHLGRGVTVGAGSVVTKSVPPFHVVAGNPARIIRKIDSDWDDGDKKEA